MNDNRERFEAWWPTVGQTIGEVAAWLAWQEAERQMIERCAKVCEGEEVEIIDLEDAAYNLATRHCADRIRTIAAEERGES